MKQKTEQEWAFLGAGNYNDVYKSADGKCILKVQKNVDATTDSPERSARLWNLINPNLPPATIIESEHGLGWVCPYIEGEQASDAEISLGLLDVYNKTGRIVVDATAPKNFLKTPSGDIVCIDIGMALRLENSDPQLSPQRLMDKEQHSIISEQAWNKYKGSYEKFFKGQQFPYPQATDTVKALLYIKEHRPDIVDVSFLKGKPEELAQLAKAFDEQKDNERFARSLGENAHLMVNFTQNEQKEKAHALLSAEKSPNLDSAKESCIKELERYINSRGKIHEGKFSPSFITKVFRDAELTAYKVTATQELIEHIRNASSLEDLRGLVENTYTSDPKLSKATFFSSDLERSMAKCISIADSVLKAEPQSELTAQKH
ncbi:hypothetical protein ACD661_00915 [Legionella lytica]|uniref:Uncharacterized protein n=1 Tax=Legionella lytica TaxID=96232 RepID=A0ABW8D351_9GAMM